MSLELEADGNQQRSAILDFTQTRDPQQNGFSVSETPHCSSPPSDEIHDDKQ